MGSSIGGNLSLLKGEQIFIQIQCAFCSKRTQTSLQQCSILPKQHMEFRKVEIELCMIPQKHSRKSHFGLKMFAYSALMQVLLLSRVRCINQYEQVISIHTTQYCILEVFGHHISIWLSFTCIQIRNYLVSLYCIGPDKVIEGSFFSS